MKQGQIVSPETIKTERTRKLQHAYKLPPGNQKWLFIMTGLL